MLSNREWSFNNSQLQVTFQALQAFLSWFVRVTDRVPQGEDPSREDGEGEESVEGVGGAQRVPHPGVGHGAVVLQNQREKVSPVVMSHQYDQRKWIILSQTCIFSRQSLPRAEPSRSARAHICWCLCAVCASAASLRRQTLRSWAAQRGPPR